MKPDEEPELAAEDRRLIESIDAAIRPAPMSPARRAAFHAALEKRIARSASPWRLLAPAFAAAVAAAVTLWLVKPEETPLARASGEDSELYAFMDSGVVSAELTDASGYLPDDYRALALLIEPDEAAP